MGVGGCCCSDRDSCSDSPEAAKSSPRAEQKDKKEKEKDSDSGTRARKKRGKQTKAKKDEKKRKRKLPYSSVKWGKHAFNRTMALYLKRGQDREMTRLAAGDLTFEDHTVFRARGVLRPIGDAGFTEGKEYLSGGEVAGASKVRTLRKGLDRERTHLSRRIFILGKVAVRDFQRRGLSTPALLGKKIALLFVPHAMLTQLASWAWWCNVLTVRAVGLYAFLGHFGVPVFLAFLWASSSQQWLLWLLAFAGVAWLVWTFVATPKWL